MKLYKRFGNVMWSLLGIALLACIIYLSIPTPAGAGTVAATYTETWTAQQVAVFENTFPSRTTLYSYGYAEVGKQGGYQLVNITNLPGRGGALYCMNWLYYYYYYYYYYYGGGGEPSFMPPHAFVTQWQVTGTLSK